MAKAPSKRAQSPKPQVAEKSFWRWTLAMVLAVTALRLFGIFQTPLQLYPDEAQYWLWSRELAFGYFSKPPMIAWLIAATTYSHGSAEEWVRLGAPLVNAGTALVLFHVGRLLFGAREGFAAAGIFLLMPGIALASAVISTDTPLLFFLSLSLLFYGLARAADGRRRLIFAAALGAGLGLAMLSKYAALYGVAGLALHSLLTRDGREKFGWAAWGATLALFLLVLAPNLAWNAAHSFATVGHTAANAEPTGKLFNPAEFAEFFGGQFGVFGPLPFAVLLGGAAVLIAKKRLQPNDLLLLAFAAPPLIAITLQALFIHANANWAAAAYVPASVLVAAWMLRWKASKWLIGGLAVQGVVALLFLALIVRPDLAEPLNLSNSFKRAKGWAEISRAVEQRARLEDLDGLTVVAADDRFLFNELAYYGRDYFGKDGPPLAMWASGGAPRNQAEAAAPLTVANGERVLVASLEGAYRPLVEKEFTRVLGEEIVRTRLDEKRFRRAELFIGEGYKGAIP